jgi:hypothetical protein
VDGTEGPLRVAVEQSFAEHEIPDRLLRKAAELMLDRGVPPDEIAAKFLEWAVVAAREAGQPDLWRVAFARSGELV